MKETCVVLVNCQRDFTDPGGVMYEVGNSEVAAEIVRFLNDNFNRISRIVCTLTNNFPFQIFSPPFWVDQEGNDPEPDTTISAADIELGIWKPSENMASMFARGNNEWLLKHCKWYAEHVGGIVIKPLHCIHGTYGYCINDEIDLFRIDHAIEHGIQAECEVIGGHPLVEFRSVFAPHLEDRHDGEGKMAWKNVEFVQELLRYEQIFFAGPHGVEETIEDLRKILGEKSGPVMSRIKVVESCVSSSFVAPEGVYTMERWNPDDQQQCADGGPECPDTVPDGGNDEGPDQS